MLLSYIEALEALAREGTMTQAGRSLRLTQSAISKRIQSLEDSVGFKLIQKKGRKVELTPKGIRFLQKTNPLLGELRSAIAGDRSLSTGVVSLGVSESILSSWGPRIISKAASSTKPMMKVEFHAHRSPVVVDRVLSGEYMMGLCAGFADHAPGLHVETFYYEPMVILFSGGKKTRVRSPMRVISIEETSATWSAIARKVSRQNIQVVSRLESFFSVAQTALAGFGHALVPFGVAKSLNIPTSSVRTFSGRTMARPVSLVARKSTFGRPMVQALWKSIIQHSLKLQQ